MEYFREITNNFGGPRYVSAICLMALLFFIINLIINKKGIRITTSILSTLIIVLEISSLYFTQTFVGYQFFVHLNFMELESMISLYKLQIIIGVLLSLFFIGFYYYSRIFLFKKINFLERRKKYLLFVYLASICFITMTITTESDFVEDTSSLFSIVNIDNSNFEESLLGSNIKDYITPEKLEAEQGKNIIVISLESLERSFLNNNFSHLTPNLNRLKNNWSYYDMEENAGSNWTSASLYTVMTGFPAYFGVEGNSIFQTAYDTQISSISHTLKKANYSSTYMNGNASFAGIKTMLYTLDFKNIIDKYNVEHTGSLSKYGLRDKDLFELAKKNVSLNKLDEKPFSLFISTTDTHFPNGFYDARMEKFISPQATDLEFMVSAVDYMVGDFISFLEEEDMLSNTAVYIFPDHLKMGDPSMFGNEQRGLYLITNAKQDTLNIDTLETMYQIDLPKIILDGAEIEHNQKFLTDYISGNKNEYILENIHNITAINTSGLLRKNAASYVIPKVSLHYDKYKSDTLRYIAHAGGMIDGYSYTNSLEALELNYQKGFRLFELDIIKTSDGKYVAAHDWEQWKSITNYQGDIPVSYQEFLSYKIHNQYTPLGIIEINEWFKNHSDAILVTDKVNEPKLFSDEFVDTNRLMMELFTMKAVKEGLEVGILSSMPSQSVIKGMSGQVANKLKNMGVKDIAISRKFIVENLQLLENLKKNDIKAYVFHVNFSPEFDEEYVVKYEFDYIYGMYADKWNF